MNRCVYATLRHVTLLCVCLPFSHFVVPFMSFSIFLIFQKADEPDSGARAVLKGRLEGALRKQQIVDLCMHHFFGADPPKLMS
jgi:hypothetical protein